MKRKSKKKGFTLIELVMVIVIIGILSAIALPKFIDLTSSAKQAATKGGLGAIRSAVAVLYASRVANGSTEFPSMVESSDLVEGRLPTNQLNSQSAIVTTDALPSGTSTNASAGWWYISSGDSGGRVGAFSDGTIDTAEW